MMKRSLLIVTVVFVYILFNSQGCGEDDQSQASREQKRIEKTADSITTALGSDEPSAITLLAFEETAKIRFSDFLDYLQIVSDPGIAPAFSRHACEMIGEQFISDSLFLRFTSRGTAVKTEIKIADILEEGSVFRQRIDVIHPDSIWLTENLHRINDTTFAGMLGYTSDTLTPSSGYLNYFPAEGIVEFFAVKRAKRFGHDTLKVWTVLLGKNEAFQK